MVSTLHAVRPGWLEAGPSARRSLIGSVFGLVIYLFNFYAMTAVFPWFAEARNWVSIVAHAGFDLVLELAYPTFARPRA